MSSENLRKQLTKKQIKEYLEQNPMATNFDIERALKIPHTTFYINYKGYADDVRRESRRIDYPSMVGEIRENKRGQEYKIIRYEGKSPSGKHYFRVEFLKTNNREMYRWGQIKAGTVYDTKADKLEKKLRKKAKLKARNKAMDLVPFFLQHGTKVWINLIKPKVL